MAVCWGVDLGASALHGVALDERYRLLGCGVFDAADVHAVADRLAGAAVVAIVTPAGYSKRPHSGDESISRKFQAARCAEVALGRDHGYWVPFVSPVEAAAGWMQVGFDLYAALAERGAADVIEVYPHACFRELGGGGRLPKKTTVAGLARRMELLRELGLDAAGLQMWSHDALDAAVAAVTAVQKLAGRGVEVGCDADVDGCDHDGSVIWLPERPQPRLPTAQAA